MSELAESKVACDRQRPLTILFGTQSGIAERVALRIARLALKRGATAVTCLPADDVPLHRWHALGSPILIVCSNASQGQPPASFMQTWCAMLQPDVTPMTGISYAVFGVGHSKFYKFNYMGKMIHNRMKQLGGRPLLLRGLGNECDSHGLDTALQPWLMQLWSSLGWLTTEATAAATAAAAATAQEQEQTPSTTLPASPLTEQAALEATFDLPLFPLYRVEPVEQKDGRYLGQHASDYLDSPLRTSGADGESARLSARDAACLTQRIYGAEAPVLCEVVSNRRVTPAEYEQDVHALRLRVLHHTTPCSDIAAVDTAASCGMTGNESMCRDKDDCACRDANGDVLLERGSTNNNGRSVDCSNSSSCSSREGNDHGSACAGMVDDNTAQHNGTSAGWNTGLDGDGVRSSSVLRYSVGDSLGVWCPNSLTLVEKMLHLLHLDGTRVVCVRPDNSHGLIRHPRQIFCRRPMTLRFLLTHYVDLEAFVSQEFIEMMLHYIVRPAESTDANDAGEEDVIAEVEERLRELCDPRKYGEFMSFSYQEKRNVCEVLFDFPMIRPPLEMVLSFVRVMKPRYFSLASSPTADAQCPTPLDLLVARLDWQTPMRRHRRGMCSSYLVDALARTRLPCCLLEGTLSLPSAPTPLICIATGTGVAPIRALVRECAARCLADRRTGDVNARWGEMPIYLFFGCRHAEKDYYFAEEWTTMMRMMRTRGDEEEGAVLRQLRVIPAFSRAGATKCYVQHKLGEHAREIGALLRPEVHACVYVCGNAATMPKDVEATLEQIMSAVVCEGDDAWATREMRRMSREGRYQHDMLTLKRKLTDVHLENSVLRYQLYQMNALLSIAMSKLSSLGVALDTPIDVRALQAGVQRYSTAEAAQTGSAGGGGWGLHESDRERARPPSKRFQMRSVLREHNKAVQSCAFSPGEEPLIVSCGLDGRIVLHNFFTAATQWEVRGHEENVVDVAWFDATQNILSGSYDNTVKLWDPRSGEAKALYHHSTHAFVLSLTPLDRSFVFACSDASRRTSIVDVRAHKPITWEHDSRVNAMTYDPATTQLILGHGNGEISVWDIRHAGAALFATSTTAAAVSSYNYNNTSIVSSNGNNNHYYNNLNMISAASKAADNLSCRSSSLSSIGAERAAIVTAALATTEAALASSASASQLLHPFDLPASGSASAKEGNNDEDRGSSKVAAAVVATTSTPMMLSSDAGLPGAPCSAFLSSLPPWQSATPHATSDGEAKRASPPVQCVSRILNDTSHASISFLEQLNLHDEGNRLLCTSADNMVRVYNSVLDAQRTESRGGDVYQLRNVCANVPSRGFRVRAGFWKGNRDKPQASVFFDDCDKDNEQPAPRRLTECDLVITGGVDNTATVFDVTDPGNAVVLDYLAGHRDRITGATVRQSQSRLIVATTSVDASIRIWVPAK